MQTFVNLDDMLGYFAQFVFGKGILHFSVYRFIAVGFHGELLQFGDRHSQFMCESVEHNY